MLHLYHADSIIGYIVTLIDNFKKHFKKDNSTDIEHEF